MTEPRFPSCPPKEQKCQGNDCQSVEPGEQSPFRIRNFKETNRQQHQQRSDSEDEGDMVGTARCAVRTLQRDVPTWGRPVLPSKPEKVERKEWDEPTEVVLLVHRPFATKLSKKSKP